MTTFPSDLGFWAIQFVSMALAALLIPKLRVTSIFGPVLAVAALAFINSAVWSSELFSALPNHISVHTGALVLMNGAIFWLVVKLLPGIETDGILPSLVAPIVFTLCTLAVPRLASQIDWQVVRSKTEQVVVEAKNFVKAPVQNP